MTKPFFTKYIMLWVILWAFFRILLTNYAMVNEKQPHYYAQDLHRDTLHVAQLDRFQAEKPILETMHKTQRRSTNVE